MVLGCWIVAVDIYRSRKEGRHGRTKTGQLRHELKYLISSAEVTMLRTRLSGLISLDAHAKDGHYTIRSLYFDDYDDRCLLENENGTDPREKFRIRIYNGSAERISLECKRKERGMTHKTSCPLTREQTELLMAGKIVPMWPIGRPFSKSSRRR